MEKMTASQQSSPPATPTDPDEVRYRVVAVELSQPVPDLDVRGFEAVLAVAMLDGEPIGRTTIMLDADESHGDVLPGASLEASVRSRLWMAIWKKQLERIVHERLGGPWWEAMSRIPTTVAVCTRDRHAHLTRCLKAIARLDPAPDCVLVVDNASREPCRDIVDRHGFDYVFEPVPGLDNARNRALASCETELIVFTDDDCLPIERWLAPVQRHFHNRATGAVTGWGSAFRLDSSAQIVFEGTGGFSRGFATVPFDWECLKPTNAGVAGAGANMAFRTAVARALGGFPPELDAGTPTASGGDTYMLGRVLAAGYRVVFDPASMVWHDHRADVPELRRVMNGYGLGIGSMLTRSLVSDTEPPAFFTLTWPFFHLLRTGSGVAKRRESLLALLAAAEQARGMVQAPVRWTRSRRASRPARGTSIPSATIRAADGVEVPPRTVSGTVTEISVVIPTVPSRGPILERCLRALSAQTLERDRFEVIVVPNGPGAGESPAPDGADVVIRNSLAGAAAARNAGARAARGPFLVMLDDDIVPESDCLAAHLAQRRSGAAVSLGPAYPAGIGRTLAEQFIARWWFDHYARKHRPEHRISFVDFLTGNLGIERETFLAFGGLDESFDPNRREDWELGCRLLGAGVAMRVTPRAVAVHHHTSTPMSILVDRFREGYGDVLLAARHPVTYADLPLASRASPGDIGGRWWRADLSLARFVSGPAGRAVVEALDGLERAKMRMTWRRLVTVLDSVAYRRGVQQAIDDGHPLPDETLHRSRLDLANGPLPEGLAFGPIDIAWDGRELGHVRTPDGQWDADSITQDIVDQLAGAALTSRVSG